MERASVLLCDWGGLKGGNGEMMAERSALHVSKSAVR